MKSSEEGSAEEKDPRSSEVYLVVIRLEIGDSSDWSGLSFQASWMPQKRKQQKWSAVVEGGKNAAAAGGGKENLAAQRGKRVPGPITVSTFQEAAPGPSREGSQQPADGRDSSTDLVPFFSGNPFVEKTEGLLHIYKRNEMRSLTEEVGRSEMLCMLAVPAVLSSQDLLQFLSPCSPGISQMRIIRDQSSNQYMVLLKFRTQKLADDFYRNFNGNPYSSLEPNLVCHLVYVAQVETMKESEGGCLPVEGHTELPTCPVCLERMDESVDGILTILCNHSFHGSCLSQWGDTSCPVCRFCQTPEATEDQKCTVCGKSEDLWICLICGYIGCGRYGEAHALNHFQETSHTFSLQVGTNRVWDYAGDNYVHRLIQSKTDGKVVEYEPAGRNPAEPETEEKIEGITLEYTYLLTNQLESQRHFFENKLANIEKLAQAQMEDLENRLKEAMASCCELETKVGVLATEKQQTERKLTQTTTRLNKLSSELAEERSMNKCLRSDQQKWHDQVAGLEKKLTEFKIQKEEQIDELNEQLRDLMFHFEAESKMREQEDDIQEEMKEGNLELGAKAPTAGQRKKKKK